MVVRVAADQRCTSWCKTMGRRQDIRLCSPGSFPLRCLAKVLYSSCIRWPRGSTFQLNPRSRRRFRRGGQRSSRRAAVARDWAVWADGVGNGGRRRRRRVGRSKEAQAFVRCRFGTVVIVQLVEHVLVVFVARHAVIVLHGGKVAFLNLRPSGICHSRRVRAVAALLRSCRRGRWRSGWCWRRRREDAQARVKRRAVNGAPVPVILVHFLFGA